jgi:ABC-type enterochelin transport system ATPase subunit
MTALQESKIIKDRNRDITSVLYDINLTVGYTDHIAIITSEGEHYCIIEGETNERFCD